MPDKNANDTKDIRDAIGTVKEEAVSAPGDWPEFWQEVIGYLEELIQYKIKSPRNNE